MSELKPPAPALSDAELSAEELRILTRSPHPYHRHRSELLEPSDRLIYRPQARFSQYKGQDKRDEQPVLTRSGSSFTKESTPGSDSGTEADDEHFLKGLPAPKPKPHKGLRGKNESLSGTSTPLPSPAVLEEEGRRLSINLKRDAFEKDIRIAADRLRRRKESIRRLTEVLLLSCLGGLISTNQDVQPFLSSWRRELLAQSGLYAALLFLYPFRVVSWAIRRGISSKAIPISIPPAFDPAPVIYPPIIPIFVSLLIADNTKSVILPNLVLSICSIPRVLVPFGNAHESYNPLHWLLSCVPIFVFEKDRTLDLDESTNVEEQLPRETLVLLYPLHQTLCLVLHYLTATSLLTAELQLLSVALINVLLLSYSPQAMILKSLLWVGGLGILLFCGQVIRWGITLARVPKWRFRRVPATAKRFSIWKMMIWVMTLRQRGYDGLGFSDDDSAFETGESTEDSDGGSPVVAKARRSKRRGSVSGAESITFPLLDGASDARDVRFDVPDGPVIRQSARRHTLPSFGKTGPSSKTHTPSGRRKRSASSSVRAFFSLTQSQATVRKWAYAAYVYASTLAIVFVGVRAYVQQFALSGNEPIGWALGYLFGDLPWFRFEVVKANLEYWVCLPPRSDVDEAASCALGWVQHLRHISFGEANTRLILSAYWGAIIVIGLLVVFQLSPIYEVDTRRKVFHFMMVAMFLPATFVDPTYVALALSLMLAIFLILDLLRASQLPPLSKPIAAFLTPYVDGRDLRGPVVISHIFLLIGCAIPLWLSLAALPRTGTGYMAGWEVPTRDASMISGIVCVGLGDAAASLIGRRWGHRKWLWGGGKSLEGSLAFATAVVLGLMSASLWLRVGGWPVSYAAASAERSLWSLRSWLTTARNTSVCASVASLTEAVLTGGNDNVIVPVVLWTCVKSLGIS